VHITSLELVTQPEADPFPVDLISLALRWDRSGIQLSELRAVAPAWSARASGRVLPVGTYPMAFVTELSVSASDLLQAQAGGRVFGDLSELRIEQSVEGEVMGELRGMLRSVLTGLQWDLELGITQLPPSILPADAPPKVRINLQGTGDRVGAEAWLAVRLQEGDVGDPAVGGSDREDEISWLDLRLHSQCDWMGDGLVLAVGLDQLNGSMRGRTLGGSGAFRMTPDGFALDDLTISAGASRIELDGRLDSEWNVNWRLRIPDLTDLLPDSGGRIEGQGTVRGSKPKPMAAGVFWVDALAYQDAGVEQADAEFSVGRDPSQPLRVVASAQAVTAAGQSIPCLSIQLGGTLSEHIFVLDAAHEAARMQVTAAGGYSMDATAWEGGLQQFRLDAGPFGEWTMKAPNEICLSSEQQVLSAFCLVDQQTEVCAEADWGRNQGRAALSITGLSFEQFGPSLPSPIKAFDGVLNLTARASLEDRPVARVEAVLDVGGLTYLDPAMQPVRLDHRNGRVEVVLDSRALSANARWEIGPHSISGEVSVPRDPLEDDPLTAPLEGGLHITVADLDWLTAIAPDIEQAVGSIDAQLAFGGSIGDPKISGHAQLVSDQVLIPMAGLTLTHIGVRIGGGGDELSVNGAIRSGAGKLDLVGGLRLDAESGWPLALVLTGDRFQAVRLPEALVSISPHLTLETGKEGATLRGYVLIPECLLTLKEVPAGSVNASTDEVLVSGEEVPTLPGAGFDGEVTVELGDGVRFQGFGLNVALGGKLTVKQDPGRMPAANGELTIRSGSYRAYGQELSIAQGRLSYAGGPLDDPGLNLRAGRRIGDTIVGVILSGTAQDPHLSTFSSDPDLQESDRISMLVTGQKAADLSKTSFYQGREISPNLSVGVNLNAGGEGSEFVTRYRLWNKVTAEGTTSSKKSGVNLSYFWVIP
jgi:translocation and assembly module TamB